MRRLRDRAAEQRGAILVMSAFAIVSMLGLTALVVDIVMLDQTKIRAQATVDSAVLAAAQDLDDIPTAVLVAQDYAARNFGVTAGDWDNCSDPNPLAVPTTVNCISVDDAVNPTFIRIRLPGRQSPTFFGSLFGVDVFTVKASASAEVEWLTGSGGTGLPTEDLIEEKREEIATAYGDCTGTDTSGAFSVSYSGGCPVVDDLLDELDALQQEVADAIRTGTLGQGCDIGTSPSGPPDTGGATVKWGEYVFFFEHLDGNVTKVCGTSADRTYPTGDPSGIQWGMDTWMAGVGGTTYNPGTGMPIHVSCSLNFIAQDGWDNENKIKYGNPPRANGPTQILDPEWHVVQYIGARWEVAKKTENAKIERKLKNGELEMKVKLATVKGQLFLKHGCNYAFTPVTSSFVPLIRLSD